MFEFLSGRVLCGLRSISTAAVVGGVIVFGPSLSAQTEEGALPVEERLQILEEELENVKLEKATKRYESVGGRGPAASEVYHSTEGLTWGGYGEVKYRDYQSSFRTDQADVHRFILYAGYRFNDWIVLNTEIEYEHAGFVEETVVTDVDFTDNSTSTSTVNEGEVFVEFAYLDFEFSKAFQMQLGLNLLPVGVTNYRHEPTTFLGVERPRTESDIIPSTWREIGAIFHGEIGELFLWRAGVVNGPRGVKFSESSWIRGGRTKGSLSRAQDFAYVASLDFVGVNGMTAGGSYYRGDSGQGEISKLDWTNRFSNPLDSLNDQTGIVDALNEIDDNRLENARIRVHIAEGHLEYNAGPVMFRALYAQGWMNEDDARAVNAATGKNIGQRVSGGYGELGYNILSFFETAHKLYPFVRYERLNTQEETVRRYAGGEEDINDFVCGVVLQGTCKVSESDAATLAGYSTISNRQLGIIENSDALKEAYGVQGTANRVNDRRILTLGLAYYPHPNVVLKGEYERWESKTDFSDDIEGRNPSNNKIDRISFAVGFIF